MKAKALMYRTVTDLEGNKINWSSYSRIKDSFSSLGIEFSSQISEEDCFDSFQKLVLSKAKHKQIRDCGLDFDLTKWKTAFTTMDKIKEIFTTEENFSWLRFTIRVMLQIFMEIQKDELIPVDYLKNFLTEIDEISVSKRFNRYDKTAKRTKFPRLQ